MKHKMKPGQTRITDPGILAAAKLGLAALTIAKTPRNSPCPCGSGKKVKKCCLPDVPNMRRQAKRDYMFALAKSGEKEKPVTVADVLTAEPVDSPFHPHPNNLP